LIMVTTVSPIRGLSDRVDDNGLAPKHPYQTDNPHFHLMGKGQVDERGDQYADTAIIDTRDEGWRAQEVRATPTSTEHRVTIRDVEDLSYTAPRTKPEKTMAIKFCLKQN